MTKQPEQDSQNGTGRRWHAEPDSQGRAASAGLPVLELRDRTARTWMPGALICSVLLNLGFLLTVEKI
jgi:hypothetical protein